MGSYDARPQTPHWHHAHAPFSARRVFFWQTRMLNKNAGTQQLETVVIGLTFGPRVGATFSSFIGPTASVSQQMKAVCVGANYAHTYKTGFCKVLEVPSFIFGPTSEVPYLEFLLILLLFLCIKFPKTWRYF